ncbi:MAG: T9SS type A sorting domain-containing protein [Richelia sp. RM2_1_2]|nr:T9SS type A sorting domain-containing protein [Richelia sp. RM2_1_2]
MGYLVGFSFLLDAPDYLNCYRDEDKYYQFGDIDCDSLISLYTSVHQETKGQGNQEKVYPNPFTESISIAHDPFEVSYLSISDSKGQVIKAFQPDTMTDINLSNLPSGVYLLTLSFRNGSITTYRVIKK